jgi:UDP-glucose 4-epimerase
MLKALREGQSGQIWVRKTPAARVIDIAAAMAYGLIGDRDYPRVIIGIRPGEKIHEVLVSREEMWRADEHSEHYVIHGWDHVGVTDPLAAEYSSGAAELLGVEAILELLRECRILS